MFEFLVWLRETDSTQKRLKEGNFPCGTVLVADRQKEGKGRKGRRWESQEGGLYFSFVLCEEDFSRPFQIPLVVGLAISDFLDSLGLRTTVKWPNDVYSKGRKIAGILVEKTRGRIIVGIGINVNQESFPPDIEDRATSMHIVSGRRWDRKEVLLGVLEKLRDYLEWYKREGFRKFKDRIEDKLLFKGEEVIILSEEPVVGLLEGIDEEGFLILRTSRGLEKVTAGDVSLRPHL